MGLTVSVEGNTGAFVKGVDLNETDESDIDCIRSVLGEHGVAFFRDQNLTPEAHISLAENFGAININRFFTAHDEFPQIAQVLKEPDQKSNIGEQWHTDHSYDQIPALGSILVARQLPTNGGDTLFVNMFAAYQALPADTKNRISKLTATHSSRHVFGEKAYTEDSREDLTGRISNAAAATQDAIHPMVISHPFSGKPALYVNPQFTTKINALDEDEGQQLLEQLYKHCLDDAFVYRFQWQENTVAFWDNRASWHRALNDYAGERRLMHRITVEGSALSAASFPA